MAELIKTEFIHLPRLFAVGTARTYNMEEHMKNNQLGAFWDECFALGFLAKLEAQADFAYDDAYVGLMTDWKDSGGSFTYLIGLLMKEGFVLPEGCRAVELSPTAAAVGWIRGKDAQDVCAPAHQLTEKALRESGRSCDEMTWCMELYNCPRFTTPDENGLITLDYYIPCD